MKWNPGVLAYGGMECGRMNRFCQRRRATGLPLARESKRAGETDMSPTWRRAPPRTVCFVWARRARVAQRKTDETRALELNQLSTITFGVWSRAEFCCDTSQMANRKNRAEVSTNHEHELGLMLAAMTSLCYRPFQPCEVAQATGLSIEVVTWHLDGLAGRRGRPHSSEGVPLVPPRAS